MKNECLLKSIKKEANRIEYSLEIKGRWKECFNKSIFFIEYNEHIEQVPDSVAVIPF